VPSAREIRAKLRKKDDDERKRREDAVVAVADAAASAVKARAEHEAALREAFEAALKTRDGDADRIGKLRAAFEAALTGSALVAEAEAAAGQAVNEATALKVTQAQLAEFTEQKVEDLRRWAQAARQSDGEPGAGKPDSAGGKAEPERAPRPAAGYAVVTSAEPAEDRGGADDAVEAAAG
jgi:hypothetical protein